MDKAISPRRFVVILLAGFSAFALVLARLGIYSVISCSINYRRQELGIRLALGASAGDLQARIVLNTLCLTGLGLLVGVPASWLLAQTLRGLLFGITAADPLTLFGMPAILLAVASLAGYLPARRASRIDPMIALHGE